MTCPECGFDNAEGANYCQKCGAYLAATGDIPSGETTEAYTVDDTTGELKPVDLDRVTEKGATLVIRTGGGRGGETFPLDNDRMTIGRNPDAEIFLDDVTVSRRHATFTREGDTFTVSDAGSLNGTYVNRDRIDTVVLKDTDEVQIGKYRLVFFQGHEHR
jgi:pSer/pThr/pTyr-binding forkhead associated (FHA) protein